MEHYRHPLQRPDLRMALKTKLNGPKMVATANATAASTESQKWVKTLCYSNISAKISEMEQYRHPLQRPDLRMALKTKLNGPKTVATANATAAGTESQKRVETLG